MRVRGIKESFIGGLHMVEQRNKIPSAVVALIIIIGSYVLMRFVISPPFPSALTNFFMLFIIAGVVIYITLEDSRINEFLDYISFSVKVNPIYGIIRIIAIAIIPLFAAYNVYSAVRISYTPPGTLFQPHPTPPGWVVGLNVPKWAADPAIWDKNLIEEGKLIYEDNCASCHGKDADGRGPDARALRYPAAPTNFKEPGTIAQLPLSYVYWRVRDGGINDPFMSSMPGWGQEMDDDEIWKTIMYMYTKAGVKPRTW